MTGHIDCLAIGAIDDGHDTCLLFFLTIVVDPSTRPLVERQQTVGLIADVFFIDGRQEQGIVLHDKERITIIPNKGQTDSTVAIVTSAGVVHDDVVAIKGEGDLGSVKVGSETE